MTDSRTSLVQIIPHTQMGGMQQVAYALDEGLPAHGVDSTIISLETELETYRGRTGLARYWADLCRRWRRERPDVVMAHTLKNALFTLPAARAAGVRRRVVVVHASRPILGEPRTRMLQALAMTGTCTDVVYCGQAAAETFAGLPRAVHERSVTIQNGIRLPECGDAARQIPTGVPELVIAGRLDPLKNVQVAIDAVTRMQPEVVLHVYGDGEQRAELEARAAASPNPQRVRFHGAVERTVLNEQYQRAAALLFPSLGEGLPLVLIEAAAAGVPVVAGPLACNREVLGEAGAYATGSDPDEWARLLTEVVQDEGRRAEMVRLGRQRVDRFALPRMVDDYARLLTATP